jgi:hypothetical protein
MIKIDEEELKKQYRREYYEKNKVKIQAYQKEYYKKKVQNRETKPYSRTSWRGAKPEFGFTRTFGAFVLKFD